MGLRPIDLDPFANRPSPLARWDPRAKLLGLGGLILVQASLSTTAAAAIGLGVSLLILAAARLPIGFCVRRIGSVGLLLLPFLILLPLLGSGPVLWRIGPVDIRAGGAEFAGIIALRAGGIMALALALLNSAHLADTLWAAQSLGVPRTLVQLALLTLRYIPILTEEYISTTTAALCRAFRPSPTAHTYRTTANVAGAVLVRAHRRAERVWQAMACRGFAGRMYPLRSWRMTFADASATMTAWLLGILLLTGDRWPWVLGLI